MRILVCGGRDYADYLRLEDILCQYVHIGVDTIISGMARGADTLATDWCNLVNCEFETYPALWNLYGNRAGVIRNQQMLDTGIDLVIAFPGGVGTKDMIKRAKKAGVKVLKID